MLTRRIEIQGIVQGVGFRPFVYNLAGRLGIKGDVANTSSGVIIHAQGDESQLTQLIRSLKNDAPPLAHIVNIETFDLPSKLFTSFSIIASDECNERSTLISPDVAVCDDCHSEMANPTDRRFGHPFINCTNCGPRYTIIDDLPYDRPQTTMADFTMCAKCRSEYSDPTDRRFHAQPIACPVCGPHLELLDATGQPHESADVIASAQKLLAQGRILAVKGLGGFHLAVDATNADAVTRLRKKKGRQEEKPFALMAESIDQINTFSSPTHQEETLLKTKERPIVLLHQKQTHSIAPDVAPNNHYFGVMLPYTPLHHLLVKPPVPVLVMTSANQTGEPLVIDNRDAVNRLKNIADNFLVHNRDILIGCDDSLMRCANQNPFFLRRARGYVPVPVFLKTELPPTLGLGALLKNTVCLTKEDRVFVSQHIGDLENLGTLRFFTQTIEHLSRILEIRPEIVAFDRHPDYLSSRHGRELANMTQVPVQHHHAHIVSCMAENHLTGPAIGLAFDGTGLGDDGTVWGGEVLIVHPERYERVAHMAYLAMPGSNAAIEEPWRMGVSALLKTYGDISQLELPFLDAFSPDNLAVVSQMVQTGLNSPLTSSIGRLFDAVAALCGLKNIISFEGQAAMLLENCADDAESGHYHYEWQKSVPIQILPEPIIAGVVNDLKQNIALPIIAARFHNTLIHLFSDLTIQISRQRQIRQVALSGGVFQNLRLLNGMVGSLSTKGLEVFTHRQVPPNDGGLCLGQAVAAAAMVTKGCVQKA